MIVLGTTITGATPDTVIANSERDSLPEASLARTVTEDVPIGNIDPLAGTATTLT